MRIVESEGWKAGAMVTLAVHCEVPAFPAWNGGIPGSRVDVKRMLVELDRKLLSWNMEW